MPSPVFQTEDDEAAYWLQRLRDGGDTDKIEAREGLVRIFARRGNWSEVAELCELQIASGVRTPQMYQRLAAAYSKAGDVEAASAALVRAKGNRVRLRMSAPTPEPQAPVANVAAEMGGVQEPPVLAQHPRPSQSKSQTTRLSGSAARLIMVILIFGVGNVLLVGGQKLMHSKDQTRLDEIHRQLDAEKNDIDRLEGQLRSADGTLSNLDADLDAQEARIRNVRGSIEALSSDIDAIELNSPNGIPGSSYSQYSQMVDEHNRLADQHTAMVRKYNSDTQHYNETLSRFQIDSKTYDDKIGRYNALVSEGNGLAKTVGTTWFIVPVPRSAGHGHATVPARR